MKSAVQVERLSHGDEVGRWRHVWEELLQNSVRPTIFATFDYVQTSIKHLNRKDEIFYLFLRKNDEIVGIFPLCMQARCEHGLRLRVVTHALPPQTTEVDKPCPIIHRDHEKDCWEAFARYFMHEFKAWDLLDLEELIRESYCPIQAKLLFRFPLAIARVKPGPESPIVKLSGEWEDFWNQHRKLRKKCGRLERRIENLRCEVTNNPNDIENCLRKYIETEKISWKEGEMVAYHQDFYAELLPLLAQKRQVWFSIMYDEDTVVSLEMAYTYMDRIYFCHGTYAPDYAVHSPGMVNSCWFIKSFFGKGYVEGDYLAGFASYVDPWAYRQERTSHVMVYRSGWKLGVLATFHVLRKIKRKLKQGR